MTIVQLVGLISFILLFIALIVWIIISTWKDRSHFIISWGRVPHYEKKALIVGFILFLALPLLKDHPAKNSYIASVLLDSITAVAGALFALGALAFLKEGHDLSREQDET